MTKKELKNLMKTAISENHFFILPLDKKKEKMILELKPEFMTWRHFHKNVEINEK